jgi:hypothetical protein
MVRCWPYVSMESSILRRRFLSLLANTTYNLCDTHLEKSVAASSSSPW